MKKLIRQLKPSHFLALLAAGIINAVGVTLFLAPVNLYDSGISGTSMLLWQVTPAWLTLSAFLVVLNLPIFLFGMKKQGAAFTVYSLFAVAVYAGASFLFTNVLPIDLSAGSPVAGRDLLLCAAFGGFISGVGSGLTLRFGGAIDGIEVLASIYARRLGITVGTFVMVYNVLLYIVIGGVFGSWTLPLYSILTYCVAIRVVDFIVEGLDRAKSVIIITVKPEEVCRALSERFGRGITRWEARGWYSGTEKSAVYFVLNRFQIPQAKALIRETDPAAFVTITEVSDVLGTGQKQEG